jgi:hypothetical protein
MAKLKPLKFMASTYVDRVNDAVCVQLGETVVYFSNKKLIAMYAQEALYRIDKLDTNVGFKRIRNATMRHSPRKVHEMSREDLAAMVEAAIMTMAAKLVDEKMGVEVE